MDTTAIIFLICIIAILPVIAIASAMFISNFSAEIRYLNAEIKRSSGESLKYYRQKKKDTYLVLIPFIGSHLYRKARNKHHHE